MAQYAEILCSGNEKCCAIAQHPFNHDACVAAKRPVSRPNYDAISAANCLLITRKNLETSCFESQWTHVDDLGSCGSVYTGAKKVGEECTDGGECAPSRDGAISCMFADVSAKQGVCTLTRYSREGDDCSSSSPSKVNCSTGGLACDAASNTCGPGRDPGEPCGDGDACAHGLCTGGICPALAQLGEPCASNSACSGDAVCNVYRRVCTTQKLPGEACASGCDVCKDGICSLGRCSVGDATVDFCAGTVFAGPQPVPVQGPCK